MDALDTLLKLALDEDIGNGDITTNLIATPDKQAEAVVGAKAPGILCGIEVVKRLVALYNPDINFQPLKQDGDMIHQGDKILKLQGNVNALLTIERTLLNFLQRLSGVATTAHIFVEQIAHTSAVLLDTRKTIPGYRILEKYAVKVGGGSNHRFGLYDMVLVKDNHISLAGSLTNAVEKVQIIREQDPHMTIEVEIESLEQLDELLLLIKVKDVIIDMIMFDNMSANDIKDGVALVKHFNIKHHKNIKIEASGGINLDTIRSIAETGVDFISVGAALTMNALSLDMDIAITSLP
ncbi:carboxylating nicotinate-nucleotide diphosphorylase [Candidatus Woesearchaeota archaeon]|nr:carboxylating nicotinate-nucleotide diphosphorylase [Candidatus Woesearchaeota archaeon]